MVQEAGLHAPSFDQDVWHPLLHRLPRMSSSEHQKCVDPGRTGRVRDNCVEELATPPGVVRDVKREQIHDPVSDAVLTCCSDNPWHLFYVKDERRAYPKPGVRTFASHLPAIDVRAKEQGPKERGSLAISVSSACPFRTNQNLHMPCFLFHRTDRR